jgi:polysaccharide pyruvyl transferase WcaK-like protein
MSINYLFKLKEYMQGIGLGDYTIDIEDFNAKDSSEIFSRLWKNKEILRSGLEQTMRDKQARLRLDIQQIKKQAS